MSDNINYSSITANIVKIESLELPFIKREINADEISENNTDQDYYQPIISSEDTDSVPIVEKKIVVDLDTTVNINNSLVKPDGMPQWKKKLMPIKQAFCTKCKTGFPNLDLYEEHLKQAHQNDRPFSCTHCQKTFAKLSSCKRHEEIHNPQRFAGPPSFACNLCPKSYHLEFSLRNHRQVYHFGYKPLKRNRNAPVVQHHSNKGTRNPNPYKKPLQNYPCPQCDLTLPYNSELRKHMLTHTSKQKNLFFR